MSNRVGRHPEWTQRRYSDEELVACLREASEALGGILTAAGYTKFSRTRNFPDGRPWPTHQTPSKRFGSWRGALTAAGLRANPSSPIAGQRLFDVPRCVDAVRHVHRELGRIPSAHDYELIAKASGGALPSTATVRDRCGSWVEALRLAGLDPAAEDGAGPT